MITSREVAPSSSAELLGAAALDTISGVDVSYFNNKLPVRVRWDASTPTYSIGVVMSDDNVSFFVQPKSLNKFYKKQAFTLTFLPEDKLWKWEVIYVQKTHFSDTAKSLRDAQKAAEKHIDHTLKLRGVT